MRFTYSVRASLSAAVFATRKSFERQLDTSPTTLFNYYCQLRNGSMINNDLQWKKIMRREWEMLSHTRRRLYFAFYFHFEGINHRSLNKFELAKFLEIATPAASEYMMFRNIFKCKFENAWLENCKNLTSSNKKGKLVKRSPIAGGHRLSIYVPLNRKQLLLEAKNHTKRYQRMCRECRRVWNEKVSLEQKMIVREKWEQEKRQFDDNINSEIDALEINLNKLNQLGPQEEEFFQLKRKTTNPWKIRIPN